MLRHNCTLTDLGLSLITEALAQKAGRFGKDERCVHKVTITALKDYGGVSYRWAGKILNREPGVSESPIREAFSALLGYQPVYGEHYTAATDQPEILIDYLEPLNATYAVRSTTADDIPRIAILEAKWFGKYAASEPIVREWFAGNPSGFFMIEKDGQSIGCLALLPFRETWMRRFCYGEITAPQITHEGIYPVTERKAIKELYAEGIVVDSLNPVIQSRAVEAVVKSLRKIVDSVCDPTVLGRIYCMPVTPAGLSIAGKLGFELSVPAAQRPALRADLYIADYKAFESRVLRFQRCILNK